MGDGVLIVAENISGHRLSYVRVLAEHAVSLGMSVSLAIPKDAPQSELFQTHLGGIRGRIHVVSPAEFSVRTLNSLAKSLAATKTIVPDGDQLLYEVLRKGGWTEGTLSLLVMRPGGQSQWALLRGLQSAVKSSLRLLSRFRKGVRPVVLVSGIAWNGSTRFAPDPVSLVCSSSDIAETRDAWRAGNRYWFGVVGALDGRKNIGLVARALSSIENHEVGLVLAGRGELADAQPELDQLRSRGIPVVRRDALLSDRELDATVGALDCVILAHTNEGPSGIFGKALASGTRIVAAGAESLRRDVAKRPQAAMWSPLAEEPLRDTLTTATRLARPPAEFGNSDDFCRVMLA